jgi:hypothetical protein
MQKINVNYLICKLVFELLWISLPFGVEFIGHLCIHSCIMFKL